MADVDWSDPCQAASALSAAYYRLLSGALEEEIRTRTLDSEEVVRFSKADTGKLEAAMIAAQGRCAAQTGGVNPYRRFALTAGSRRRCP